LPRHPGPSPPPHHHQGRSCFFLAWLRVFKVALLAAGLDPLDSALPVLPWIAAAALGIELEPQFNHAVEQGAAGAARALERNSGGVWRWKA